MLRPWVDARQREVWYPWACYLDGVGGYVAWLNQHVESRVRATVNSLAGQVDAIGQIAGGPPFGLLATVASTRAALVAAALTLAPALVLYRRSSAPRAELAPGVAPEAGG